MKTKICTTCNQEKEILKFSKHQTGKFGVRSSCKSCEKEYQEKNKEKIRDYHKDWYKENKEIQLNNCYKRYKEKREQILEQQKEYYQKHKEQTKMYPSHNPEYKKDRYLQRTYGITLGQYNKMLKEQNGVCEICGNPEKIFSKRGNCIPDLAVDHDHKTAKVRGLLCYHCNRILGDVNENIEILNKAIDYLNKHRS